MKNFFVGIAVCLLVLNSLKIKAQDDAYRVALMVPLYLEQVDNEFVNAEPNNKTLLTKPFSFLQFYEGFMIAADSVAKSRNMQLDLKVYDVDNDVKKAYAATVDPWLVTADLIVGPFYIKPFNVVKMFATNHNIPIVNPITQRSEIVDNQPYVIKVKPSSDGQVTHLENLLKNTYHANNVFIIREKNDSDTSIISKINEMAQRSIDEVSYVSNRHIVQVVKNQQRILRRMKNRYDGINLMTDNVRLNINDLKRYIDDSTAFENRVVNINYKRDSLRNVKNYASVVRNNLFIVYGNDKVFANEIVNKITKLTVTYPLTVVMLPDWSKFDGLFNENLMKMHAIYFDDNYMDYENIRVQSFICKFRNRYNTEPSEYAYQGFDIGWYFLNALRLFDNKMIENLPDYHIPLLNKQLHFQKKSETSGLENTFWSVYQFKGYNKVVLDTGY